MKIGLIGIGRMGNQLAKYFLLSGYKVLAYHPNINKVENFSRKLNFYGKIEATDDYMCLKEVDIYIMVVPKEATLEVAKKINEIITEKQWIINTATEAYLSELYAKIPSERIIAAKIIGNAYEIEKGERPAVIIDGKNNNLKEKAFSLFSDFGYTIIENEIVVTKINKIGAIEAIRTVLRIEKRFAENNITIDDELIKVVFNNIVTGTIKSYSQGNIAPFMEKIINQFKKEKFKDV